MQITAYNFREGTRTFLLAKGYIPYQPDRGYETSRYLLGQCRPNRISSSNREQSHRRTDAFRSSQIPS